MAYMFNQCSKLTELDVSHFNTSKVTNMSRMFQACLNLNSLDLSNFDTSKVTDVTRMFNGNVKLTSINLSKATFNAVTQYSYMFTSCGLTNVTVKDAAAKTFIDARLKEANINIEATKIS